MEQEIKLTDQPESTPEITVPVKYNKEIKELSLEEEKLSWRKVSLS